jgi:hypothetical protein
MLSGSTISGNSTMLRVGTTIMASAGSGTAVAGAGAVASGGLMRPLSATFGNLTIRQPSATPLTGCS